MVFSGLKEDYSQFKSLFIDACIAALPTELPYGAVGLALSDAEYILLPGITGPYVRKIDPGQRLPRPPNGAPSQSLKLWEIDNTIYNGDRVEYLAELKAEATIKTFLLDNLDPISLLAIKDPTLGNLIISPAQIWVIVHRLHGTQLPDDVDALAVKYKEVYVSGSVKAFLSTQDDYCKKLATAGEPVALRTQLRNTIDSLEPCGIFDKAITLWKILHADGTTRTAENLRDTVCTAYDTAGNGRTAGSRSAAATVAVTAHADINAYITASVAAAIAASDKVTSRSDKSAGKTTTGTNKTHYCWFHGTNCNHPSNLCRNALVDPRHEKFATAADKKGGKDTPFVPFYKKGK